MRFDLLILGDTPDAWTAAETSARLGRRTAVLRPDADGRGIAVGVAAVLRDFVADALRPTPRLSPADLVLQAVARHERAVARAGRDLGIRSWRGAVRMTARNSAEVTVEGVRMVFDADRLLIATGTVGSLPRGLPIDRHRLILPEDLSRHRRTPARLVVLGGSRIAHAAGRLFAAAGSSVTLIDAPPGHRPEAAAATCPRTVAVEVSALREEHDGITIRLTDGRDLSADAVLFAANRPGATDALDLAAAGLEADEDGRLWCDDAGRTWVPSIAAAGEVVGYPRRLRDPEAADTITRSLLAAPALDRRARLAC